MRPRTKYAESDGYSIAYQVIGDGPVDVLFVQGLMSHLDLQWCDPVFAAFLRRLSSFARLIVMDQRGVGLSDSSPAIPSIDERVADMAAVADAVGSEKMFVIGQCHGGPPAIVYTASHPERVAGLILMSTFAKGTRDCNDRGAISDEAFARWMEITEHWGEGHSLRYFNPSREEGGLYRHLYATFERAALTRGMARAAVASTREIDVTAPLAVIRVPSMVLHCTDDFVPVEAGKNIAATIPDASFIELPGADHAPFVGVGSELVADAILEFIASQQSVTPISRERFGAILFIDIVASTQAAASHGDEGWADVLIRHDTAARDHVDRHHGECLKFTGDGYLATFDSCENALRCAAALKQTAAEYGLMIRGGIHAGNYQPAGQDAIGLAVIVASRLMSAAEPGKILVSDVVHAAVAGVSFRFGTARRLTLKGVPGTVTAAPFMSEIDIEQPTGRWRPDPTLYGPYPTRVDRLLTFGAKRFAGAAHVFLKPQWRLPK
jgi:class 3 adenylate cyclase/pimeloyl-ACP methyl ester carboxylesterase